MIRWHLDGFLAWMWPLAWTQALLLTIAIGLVALLRKPLFKLGGAQAAYAAWALVPLLLAAHLAFVAVGQWSPARWVGEGVARSAPVARSEAATALPAQALGAWRKTLALPRAGAIEAWSAQRVVLGVWLLGVIALLLHAAFSHWQMLRRLRGATRFELPGCPLPVWQAAGVGPMLLGVWSPRIVVPEGFAETLSTEQQQLVLSHECMHAQRRDPWVNLLAHGLLALWWFHPLAHWALRRMRLDQEMACDAVVLQKAEHAGLASAYAQALSHFSTPAFGHAGLSATACHWPGRHPLNERIMNLTSLSRRASTRTTAFAILGSTALLGCLAVSANPTASPKPGPGEYRMSAVVRANAVGTETTHRSSFNVIQAQGKSARVSISDGKDKCEIGFKITPQANADQVAVEFDSLCGDPGRKPKLVTRLGDVASLEWRSQAEPTVMHMLAFTVTQ